MISLIEKYQKEVVPEMKKEFGYKNILAIPRITKVVVNTGFGRQMVAATGEEQKRIQESVFNDLAIICGQKPQLTRAKKSISSFKLRQGMAIGAKVTLRRKRMYDFLQRLVGLALPRTRDFQGIDPKAIDREGNMTIAVKEHISFPEISPEKSRINFGFEVTVATSAKSKQEAEKLFRLLGFPLKN
ncbi:MAG: 50S ribosomal protein L5 [Candidatus Paceibacterota bacterium]|jgi:large subunit ribosomal protein L5|nr:50S ribosomal protein L5 [Candidatus Paceibacterota bacterium]